jgi:outer membrane receptor for Fe3+-dicitrate
VRNGGKEAKEAPSTNRQASEKDQASRPGGAEGAGGQLANNKQVPKSFEDEDEAKRQVPGNGARETEGIGVNPSKSNQIFEQPRNEGTKE